jgi:hypothetical protein
MARKNRKTPRLETRHFGQAVRAAAQNRVTQLEVIEQHFAQRPDIRAKMDNLNSAGLDPLTFLDAISVPGLLQISESNSRDGLLVETFLFCGLDHRKPMHWRILLDALVQECFRGPGKPEKWNEETYYDLLIDIRAVQKKHTFANDSELARQLKQGMTRTKYEDVSFRRLRTLVAEALNPKINPLVELNGEDLITFRARRAERELGLPADIGIAKQRAALVAIALEDSVKPFLSHKLKGGEPFTPVEWQGILPLATELAEVSVKMMLLGPDESAAPEKL